MAIGCLQRALRKYVEADDPDVLILTEVKWPEAATHAELEWIRPRYKVSDRFHALRSGVQVAPLRRSG